jgi:hypothetical protein
MTTGRQQRGCYAPIGIIEAACPSVSCFFEYALPSHPRAGPGRTPCEGDGSFSSGTRLHDKVLRYLSKFKRNIFNNAI